MMTILLIVISILIILTLLEAAFYYLTHYPDVLKLFPRKFRNSITYLYIHGDRKNMHFQKWFKIDSDPELETQINVRISFKKSLGLSFDDSTPDHSTLSRFRGRFSKNDMHMINHELLSQLAAKGLTINEGVAIDARLVQSASHPLSNERLQ